MQIIKPKLKLHLTVPKFLKHLQVLLVVSIRYLVYLEYITSTQTTLLSGSALL